MPQPQSPNQESKRVFLFPYTINSVSMKIFGHLVEDPNTIILQGKPLPEAYDSETILAVLRNKEYVYVIVQGELYDVWIDTYLIDTEEGEDDGGNAN